MLNESTVLFMGIIEAEIYYQKKKKKIGRTFMK